MHASPTDTCTARVPDAVQQPCGGTRWAIHGAVPDNAIAAATLYVQDDAAIKVRAAVIVSAADRDYARVIDADGQPVKYCLEADTETGRCLVLEAGPDGLPIVDAIEGEFRLRRATVIRPAPLRLERYGKRRQRNV